MDSAIWLNTDFRSDAIPLGCFINVLKRIEECGGEAVWGWQVDDSPKADFIHLIHHVAWRSPTGEILEITPQLEFQNGEYFEVWIKTLFIPDETALPVGEAPNRTSQPPRWEAKLPALNDAAKLLTKAEKAWFEKDTANATFLTKKAERLVNSFGKQFKAPPPDYFLKF